MKSLSIIIPCYNYEKKIIENIKKLIRKVKTYKIKYEILIIDDYSKDSTLYLLKKNFFKKKNIILIENEKNEGKSSSVKKALKISKYNHIVLIDCDLPYFEKINEIIKKLKKNYDFVAINRRLKSSQLKKGNLSIYQHLRHFIGQVVSELIKFSLNLNIEACDTQAGLKGLKKNPFLKHNNFISKRFFLDLELTYMYIKQRKKIFFVPVNYEIAKESSIKLFDVKNFLIIFELIKVIFKCKKLK